MFDILFARTFLIVGGMLVITSIVSRFNKAFETKKELWATVISTFVFLFGIMFFADLFPINLMLVAAFSAIMGWEIGPTIEMYGKQFKFRKFLKNRGVILKKGEKPAPDQLAEFEQSLTQDPHAGEWSDVIFQAMSATAFAVLATSSIVFLTSIDFSFLGAFLFIALLILIVMGILNIFLFRSRIFSLVRAYFGVIIFTLYLLFDFNMLEKMAGDKSWGAAVNLAVNIYLDIINLFLLLLEILGSSD